MNYYVTVIKKYAVFSGRAQRAEYWYFALFSFIISIILGIISGIIGDNNSILSSLYFLAILIPSIAVSIRRMHDTDRSGWWILLALIPIIGWIWFLVLTVLDSTPGDNKYGPNPKAVTPSPQINQQV